MWTKDEIFSVSACSRFMPMVILSMDSDITALVSFLLVKMFSRVPFYLLFAFLQHIVLWGEVVSPRQTPNLENQALPFVRPLPLSLPGLVRPTRGITPTGVASRVMKYTTTPPHHGKVATQREADAKQENGLLFGTA